MIHSDSTTLMAIYNGFRIREKKKKAEPEELVGSPPTEIF